MKDKKKGRYIGSRPLYSVPMRVISFRLPAHIIDFLRKKGGSKWLRGIIEREIKSVPADNCK